MVSRMCFVPQIQPTVRSNPKPNPECGTELGILYKMTPMGFHRPTTKAISQLALIIWGMVGK